jgi:serine protease Do
MRSLRLALLPGLFALGIAGTAAAADGWLGVVTQSISEDLRDALNLRGDGVVVNQVVSGSPADRAGIRRGDVITSVNGRSVDSPEDLAEIVRSEDSGANVSVRIVRRGGGSQTLNVRLGSRPDSDRGDRDGDEDWKDSPTPAPTPGHTETHVWKDGKEVDPKDIEDELPGFRGFGSMNGFPGTGRPRLGVRLQKMNSDLAGYFGGTNGRGALVVEVVEDSPADRAGIKAGDVIIAVEGTNVDDPDDLVRAIADEEGRTSLTIVRRGSRRTIDADLGDRSRSDTWRMRDGRAPRAPRAPVAPGIGRNDGDEDSRREIQELRDEIRELKRQLEEKDKDDR